MTIPSFGNSEVELTNIISDIQKNNVSVRRRNKNILPGSSTPKLTCFFRENRDNGLGA